ncbi:hypothetical protein ACS0TY_002002 [Phlomoides rotata]
MGGEDVKVSVELSFLEAVQGCDKMFTILADLTCETCVQREKLILEIKLMKCR